MDSLRTLPILLLAALLSGCVRSPAAPLDPAAGLEPVAPAPPGALHASSFDAHLTVSGAAAGSGAAYTPGMSGDVPCVEIHVPAGVGVVALNVTGDWTPDAAGQPASLQVYLHARDHGVLSSVVLQQGGSAAFDIDTPRPDLYLYADIDRTATATEALYENVVLHVDATLDGVGEASAGENHCW
ncbi:MAG: hypothetical protein ABR562_04410 [Thermoplasmatota archaeon]|nr:hypothetical protein [Halobacteriales archaeon]